MTSCSAKLVCAASGLRRSTTVMSSLRRPAGVRSLGMISGGAGGNRQRRRGADGRQAGEGPLLVDHRRGRCSRQLALAAHDDGEAALSALPLQLTILRPSRFIDNVAWDIASARETGVNHRFFQPTDKAFPMVAAKDVGRRRPSLSRQTGRACARSSSRVPPPRAERPRRRVRVRHEKARARSAGAPRFMGWAVPLAGHEGSRTTHANTRRFQ